MLRDPLGRQFSYIRLSVSPLCNFRCQYCLPSGNPIAATRNAPLSVAEITRLMRGFSEMGVEKVRVSGGEPMVRSDLAEILHSIASTRGIKKVALSTNGFHLKEKIRQFRDSGLGAVNVSVDSLDAKTFHKITGRDCLADVREGIERCLEFENLEVKVNVVLMRNINHQETDRFINWTREVPLSVRFIDLMPTADNPQFFKKHYFDATPIRELLRSRGWCATTRGKTAGPAETFVHSEYRGSVGFIRPYASNFCDNCNRLRITSLGELRLCLFGNSNFPLRHLLQNDDAKATLQQTVHRLLGKKEDSHQLNEGRYEGTRNFASIGG